MDERGQAPDPLDRPAVGQLFNRYLPITENWIWEQLRQLRDFRPVVLARRTDNLAAFPLASVHSAGAQPRWRRAASRVREAVAGYTPLHVAAARAEGVRLMHAHFGPVAAWGVTLAARIGVPLIASFYGFDLGRHPRGRAGLSARYARLFERGAAFVVEGPAAGRRLLALGCPEERIVVHHLGVDPDRIPFRQRSRAPGEPLRVLMAARFTEKKGLTYGLEAIARALAEGASLSATVVGDAGRGAADQRVKRELHALVERHGLDDRVRFTGRVPVDEYRRLLYEHDVLLQPSVEAADGDCEGGLPVSLIEAAASGMALIGTRHSDIPEVVKPGVTGWLCDERDVAGLTDALMKAAENADRLALLAAGGRRLIEAEYDARRATLDPVYARVLAAHA